MRSSTITTNLSDVESELVTLQNVPVAATGLARPRRDASVETTSLELSLEKGVDLRLLLALLVLALGVVRHLLLLYGCLGRGLLLQRVKVVRKKETSLGTRGMDDALGLSW
jgi:hypothetical protein